MNAINYLIIKIEFFIYINVIKETTYLIILFKKTNYKNYDINIVNSIDNNIIYYFYSRYI